jgi:septum formation protein
VLASASPARLGLLRGAGMAPEVIVSGVREDDVTGTDTASMVTTLARRKATAVATDPAVAGALVLGCDSLLDLDGAARGKPHCADEAVRRWREMRGRSGRLLTGHCLIETGTGRREEGVVATVVRFGDPSDAEIDAYVASGEPLEVAGAFTLEGRAGPFVEGIEGDSNNVIGLSLALLRRLLAAMGIGITELWT